MTEGPRETGSGRRDPSDLVDALRRLAAVRDRDELTEAEYERAKVLVVEEHMQPVEEQTQDDVPGRHPASAE